MDKCQVVLRVRVKVTVLVGVEVRVRARFASIRVGLKVRVW